MINKLYKFFKKVFSEDANGNLSNSIFQNSFESTESDFSSNNLETNIENSDSVTPCDEVNPATGLTSYGGVDALGNPYGMDLNHSTEHSFNCSNDTYNNDFHNT